MHPARPALLTALFLASCRGDRPAARDTPFVAIDRIEEAALDYDAEELRSRRSDARLVQQVTFDGETRQALVPPLPSTIGFPVEVPEGAVFRFGMGVSTLGASVSPAAVAFKVLVEGDVVFDSAVRRREPNRWLDQEVDLAAYGGRKVELVLQTGVEGARRDTSPAVLPFWSNPVVAPKARSVEDRARRPDVILLSLDCVRADHVGVYGYERDTTPAIDAFSADGVVFEQAVSVSSFTHPTHMTMLTGIPPSIHGVSRFRKPDRSLIYLPEVLVGAGYRAEGIVSGPLLSQSFGFERGFSVYRTFHDTTRAPKLVETALSFLERGRGQPQFLFLHFFDAHWPYWPPDEFNERFGPRPTNASLLLEKVRNQIPPDDPSEIRHAIDLYDGELAYLDRAVGRFLEGLESMGLYEDAIVILTADHGEAFLEHGFWEHGQTLYEEMVHVPLIVKWPGASRRGREPALVSQVDIFPTILEAVGIDLELGLLGEGAPLSRPPSDRSVFLELTWDPLPTRDARMLVGLRSARYKYLASLEAPTVDALYQAPILHEELYDLVADPAESVNLIGEVDFGREAVEAYLARARELRASRAGDDVTLDDETLERLKALGYVEP